MVIAEMTPHIKNVFHNRFLKSISTAKGKPIKLPKGQPRSVEMATKNIARLYFSCHQAARAAHPKYIEKEDGNNAVLDTNIPTLKI